MQKMILSLVRNISLLSGLLFCLNLYSAEAQLYDSSIINIKWHEAETTVIYGDTVQRAAFDNAIYGLMPEEQTPFFETMIPVYSPDLKVEAFVNLLSTELVPDNELHLITEKVDTVVQYTANVVVSRDDNNIYFRMLPFVKTKNGIERVVSFELGYTLINIAESKSANDFAENSVLATGKWYKMAISNNGIYKITYSELEAMGVSVSSINPRNIRIYHNGGGLVPKINGHKRNDDLVEIPILVAGENDGVFNQNDYILFYARGPITWQYNKTTYEHVKNSYSDYSYAFLTVDLGEGKRIETAPEPSTSATSTINTFLDYQHREENLYNLNNMGATWYYDLFDATLSRDYVFNFPNIVTAKDAYMKAEAASRNQSSASLKFYVNGSLLDQISFGYYGQYYYGTTGVTNLLSFTPNSSNITVKLNYQRASVASTGWLDYITVNAWRYLAFTGGCMAFRNPEATDITKVYQYQLSNANANVQVWNVTDSISPKKMTTSLTSSILTFNVFGKGNNEFIAFDGSSFNTVTFSGIVDNQNLHAKRNIDYLIITHPDFYSQAERLKQIHNQIDDLVIDIVTPQPIYNEFSCGALDIAAIRDFIRMLYTKSDAGHKIKYVLLLGDASYYYKNPSVCFIPTYESFSSLTLFGSVTDDFFGCLDSREGNMENNTSSVDVAIGRMPVNTLAEATSSIDKIVTYLKKDDANMNTWRNSFTFIADDDELNFMRHNEVLIDTIRKNGGDMDVDKIYLDAYKQIATSSGKRAPDANEAINNRIERGTLIVNYIGHGGEVGWSAERMLTNDDIKMWKNSPKLPLFVTATCEFSRFDDHTRTSAGELVYLNQHGGAIAMITTARVTNGGNNHVLQIRLYRNMFRVEGGEYQTMGDMYLAMKGISNDYAKVLVFFGDPALRLAYPKYNVELSSLNGMSVNNKLDTLKALKKINLEGVVKDFNDSIMTDFNGIVYVTIYDKENTITTYGDEIDPITFKVRNNVIFNGKAKVQNGCFSIDFTVPKDIKYNYGKGRISFYATNNDVDAHGFFSNVIVGGYDDTVIPDVNAPEVTIFMDDSLFVDGGTTDENPVFHALIKDGNGINASGAGIGHDIMAILTGATIKTYNLNQYYETPLNLDDYGTLTYKFYNLNEGEHNLKFRVWDIYNNSTTVNLNFKVVKSNKLALENLHNYPNPMSGNTSFVFECNQKDNEMYVEINIYNISGQLVKKINERRFGNSMRVEPIIWDGTSDGGKPLASGMYIYNVTISNNNDEKTSDYSKLVILRN